MKTTKINSKMLITTAATALTASMLAVPAVANNIELQSNQTEQTSMLLRGGSKIFVTNDTFNSGVAEFDYEVTFPHSRIISGDWDGYGNDTLAYQDGSEIYIKNSMDGNKADYTVVFGSTNKDLVSGDFNADGTSDIAIRENNHFTIKTKLQDKNEKPMELAYGRVGDDLFVGDWDGDGLDTFAVRRGNHFHIKNDVSGGIADKVISYGRPGDEVLVGDWDGDGVDTFAVRRANQYFIKDTVTSGVADRVIAYGRVGDQVIVGDWNGDKKDSLTVRRNLPTNPTPTTPTTPNTPDQPGEPSTPSNPGTQLRDTINDMNDYDGFYYAEPGEKPQTTNNLWPGNAVYKGVPVKAKSRPDYKTGELPPEIPEYKALGYYTTGTRCSTEQEGMVVHSAGNGVYETSMLCAKTWAWDIGWQL